MPHSRRSAIDRVAQKIFSKDGYNDQEDIKGFRWRRGSRRVEGQGLQSWIQGLEGFQYREDSKIEDFKERLNFDDSNAIEIWCERSSVVPMIQNVRGTRILCQKCEMRGADWRLGFGRFGGQGLAGF
ncbi:unnamed protein product [Caenorhabditis nigoni]